MIRSIKQGLAVLSAAAVGLLLTAFTPSSAQAQTVYTCASAPSGTVTGNLIIVDTSAACTINSDISATQNISVQATGPITINGTVTLEKATGETYGSIYINGQQSVKITGNVLATPSTVSYGGDIVIDAGGTLQAGTVTTSLGGLVDLEAQLSGGNTPFVIGTSGTNGVGKVSTSGTDNGSDYTLQASTAVYVVNGNSSSTGGITITAVADLAVANGGGGRAGAIILNAQNGTLKVPGGFTLAGTTNLVGGGFLTFLANTVQFTTTATLNVSQNTATNVRPYNTQINISAANITYTTLTLNANGIGVPAGYDGLTETYPAGVFLSSQNQLEVADTQTVVDNLLTVHTIFVNPTGNPLSSLTLTGTGALTVTANGNTEQASVRGYPISISGGTTVSLSSTGSTNHGIYISNEATPAGQPGITFGNTTTVTLNANGLLTASAATTSGGYVYINGDNVAFNAKTFVIEANGPATGAGDGGIAYINSGLLSTGSAFLGAKVTANGATAGTGDAQTALVVPALSPTTQYPAITLNAGTQSNLTFGNGTTLGSFNLAATGGKTSGQGGAITVSAGNMTVPNVLSINASALATASNAGSVTLSSTNPTAPSVTFTYSTKPVVAVKAIGGTDSGLGGAVVVNVATLSQVSTNFDVNAAIDVDGGTTLTPTQNDGSISLNGILCQQTPTSNAPVWPAAFWDCTAQTGLYQSPAAVTASNISATARGKTGLTTRLRIYVFNVIGDYTTFFLGSPPVEAGETFQATTTTNPNIYSSVWLQNPAQGGGTFSDTTLREITIHEIGHGFDYFLGQSKQSGATTYNTFSSNDFLQLDYAYVDPKSFTSPTNPGASVRRLPCALTPIPNTTPQQYYPGNVPFANVVDQNKIAICAGGSLNGPYTGYTSNSSIAQAAAVGAYFFTQTSGTWSQLYAQTLAFEAYAKANSPSLYAYNPPDNLFNNGYYACTREWADKIQAGATTPPVDAACSAKLPDWYTF